MKSETSLCDRRSTIAYLSKLRQKCSSQYAIWVRAAAARNRTADATYKKSNLYALQKTDINSGLGTRVV